MRGVTIDTVRFRQFRIASGMTQRELAVRAGVGERTIRNAESGRPLRLDFARYLAAALGIEVTDLMRDKDELRTILREQSRVNSLVLCIKALIHEGDAGEYLKLMSKDVVIKIPGPAQVPMCGDFRGTDDIRRLEDINRQNLAHERPTEFRDIRASGNLVVMSGQDWLRALPTGKSFSVSWHHVYEFDNGHVVRFDNWGDVAVAAQAFQPG